MSSKPKQTKIYKNPKREVGSDFKPYIPQYKVLGKAPEQVNFSDAPDQPQVTHHAPILVRETPRNRATPSALVPKNVPYAQPSQFVLGNSLPNVGNNIETSWASVDGISVDEDEVDIGDHQMIDNNLDDKKNYASIPNSLPLPPDTESSIEDIEDLQSEEEEYIIFLDDKLLGSGVLPDVEEGVREMILVDGVEPDRISVYKKVEIKVGVFIAG